MFRSEENRTKLHHYRKYFSFYPVPQNAPHVSAGMNPVRSQPKPQTQSYGVNVLNVPKGQRPKATDVSPWYGVCRLSWPTSDRASDRQPLAYFKRVEISV